MSNHVIVGMTGKGLSCKITQTLCFDYLKFIEILKMSVDHWFIGQGP